MFVRNGEKLGSVVVDADPSDAEPKRQPARKAAAKKVDEPPADAGDSSQPSTPAAPTPESTQAETEKPAKSAKATGFKSALDKG